MTRRDFIIIADFLRASRWDDPRWHYLVSQAADYLATKNPRFNRTKFFDAVYAAEPKKTEGPTI